MRWAQFIGKVSERVGVNAERAEAITYVVFQQLRDRLTLKESLDVASQLSHELQLMWLDDERLSRQVAKIHEQEFVARVRHQAGFDSQEMTEQAVRGVFATLQEALGSADGTEGESWDIFSQLPKDMKKLWLNAHRQPRQAQ
jgi:uncharacterized protein (DUF2267 family)